MLERSPVTEADADQAAWTVWSDPASAGSESIAGERVMKVGGARAVGLALAVGRDARWPTLAWNVPGVAWSLDRIYAVIASNRHRLPGETPWCEAHPDQCETAAP